MTEDVAIEGKNLNFSVATKQGKLSPILQDCSLRIPSGELWRLFGPNGCGKFTLLKTTVEVTHLLVSDDIEWIFGPGN
ncbi:ABC transporter I family member 10 chloroplastic [Tripterygium wilfordii]|uniref:ABC transporter I family member 10 chloroplastic n=1 Tax=Tripterygium wilfordii TaxID=458696 RepID=A0A7J7DZS3_TRIWF|nr:ABC transporter I family member 10 chloroplastic [Tripterygium wilfordii]